MVKILPPFIVFDSDNSYTKEASNAFRVADTYSIKAVYD